MLEPDADLSSKTYPRRFKSLSEENANRNELHTDQTYLFVLSHASTGFGVKGYTAKTVRGLVETVWRSLRGEDSSWLESTIVKPQSLDQGDQIGQHFTIAMHPILQANPEIVHGPQHPDLEPELIHGFAAEDWYRALSVVRWFHRRQAGSRASTKTNSESSSNQTNRAVPVDYYDPRETSTSLLFSPTVARALFFSYLTFSSQSSNHGQPS